MRHIKTIILFLLFSGFCCGQVTDKFIVENIHAFKSKKITYNNVGSFAQKKKIVDELQLDTIGYIDNFPADTFAIKNYFYLTDIDSDKDLDLIFQGPINYDEIYYSTIFFINKNSVYKKRMELGGKTVYRKGNTVIQYQGPCCAGEKNTFSAYSIVHDSIYLSKQVSYFESPGVYLGHPEIPKILPKQLKETKQVEIVENSEVFCTSKDTLMGTTFLRSNVMGLISSSTTVSVFAEREDERGITWLYCLMPATNVTFIVNSCAGSFLAWVKKY